jgi:hypothetical protein
LIVKRPSVIADDAMGCTHSFASAARPLYRSGPEPFIDRGDVDSGFVADGEFVVASSHGTVAFEPVDAALHRVTLLVDLGVEGW